MSDVRQTMIDVMTQIKAERGQTLAAPHNDDTLTTTLGFDSLDLAVVVVRLEQRLGRDPFRDGRPLVPTFGQWVALYEQAEADA